MIMANDKTSCSFDDFVKNVRENSAKFAKNMREIGQNISNNFNKDVFKEEDDVTDCKKTHISSPWNSYVHKLEAFFEGDPNVKVEYDSDNYTVKLMVNGVEKSDALTQLLPDKIIFGNITLKILVIPANNAEKSRAELFRAALRGNSIFDGIIDLSSSIVESPMVYVMFKKEVAQYFDDNLADPYGNNNCLYQDLAYQIFVNKEGICFSTSAEGDAACG